MRPVIRKPFPSTIQRDLYIPVHCVDVDVCAGVPPVRHQPLVSHVVADGPEDTCEEHEEATGDEDVGQDHVEDAAVPLLQGCHVGPHAGETKAQARERHAGQRTQLFPGFHSSVTLVGGLWVVG